MHCVVSSLLVALLALYAQAVPSPSPQTGATTSLASSGLQLPSNQSTSSASGTVDGHLSWSHNIEREVNAIHENPDWKLASPLFVQSDTIDNGSSYEGFDFKDTSIFLWIPGHSGQFLATESEVDKWGSWSEPEVTPGKSIGIIPFNWTDIKVDLTDAIRALHLAGLAPTGVKSTQLLKLAGPDPYYAPGQPYYAFGLNGQGEGKSVHAVGAIDRIVIRDYIKDGATTLAGLESKFLTTSNSSTVATS